jgi:tripartite-type tricarboxylate transporter receptor subunit TctC
MRFALIVAAAALCSGLADAQDRQSYPNRPVRLVVPFPAGGGTDIFARLIGKKLSQTMGQSFVVDNRPGASGIIGCELVARSTPDGYTLLMGTTGTHTTNPAVFLTMPFKTVTDFAPITLLAESPFVLLVNPSLPVRDLREIIALAKARPGQLTQASSGIGSSSHLGWELFNAMAGITAVHVPYKGLAHASAATIAGDVTMTWDSISASVPYIRAKRLHPVAIGSAKRSPILPELPTVSEAGLPGFELGSWYGLFAPAGTPADIIRRLHAEAVKALRAPDMKDQFAVLGAEPVGSTPQEFAEVVKRDLAKWAKVAREANVKAE